MAIQNEIEKLILTNNMSNLICKPILLPSKNIAKIISSFSNTDGGFIVLGAELDNEVINIVGLSNDFNTESIIEKAINSLKPKPIIEYEYITINNRNIFAIKVLKSNEVILFNNSKYILENNEITKCKEEITLDKTKVFIVHGHDELAKIEVARFVERLGFSPIILHEQSNSGKTIIEKIEANSNVGFGVVLYTPCDVGSTKDNKDNLQPRARQNVVFEHGYLIGKIGRSNVCALVKDKVETPNDISGVVYISMDSNKAWQLSLAKEMKSAGYAIDMNKII